MVTAPCKQGRRLRFGAACSPGTPICSFCALAEARARCWPVSEACHRSRGDGAPARDACDLSTHRIVHTIELVDKASACSALAASHCRVWWKSYAGETGALRVKEENKFMLRDPTRPARGRESHAASTCRRDGFRGKRGACGMNPAVAMYTRPGRDHIPDGSYWIPQGMRRHIAGNPHHPRTSVNRMGDGIATSCGKEPRRPA